MPPAGALPEPLILSSEMLDEGGVYLLDSGADLLLYVDQSAEDRVVQVRSTPLYIVHQDMSGSMNHKHHMLDILHT